MTNNHPADPDGDLTKSQIRALANIINIIRICKNIPHLIQSGIGPF